MRERPILFSGPMVRAILEGRKTQTRRVVTGKVALQWLQPEMFTPEFVAHPENGLCPYGVPGARLWVRETWTLGDTDSESWAEVYFRADGQDEPAHRFAVNEEVAERHAAERERLEVTGDGSSNWKPSIFMPRWASRLLLEVKAVRVEQLQEISQTDAQREGMRGPMIDQELDRIVNQIGVSPREAYRSLWDSINAKRVHSWESNPWVWVVEFERVEL